ncbi:AprI/Inh family metalloprotease inhibitor [Terrarubrum flagellatum]|uniref:AprI/Inh family metalloprotease inhibitor n=1 Tax=Terrirubrum flagellatum TaxID=2895980 RepID=UPI003145525A
MRRAAFSLSAALALVFVGPSQAQSPLKTKLLAPTSTPVKAVAGPWQMASADNEAKCLVQFSAREAGGGRMILGSPPACKTKLVVLTSAVQWGLGEDGAIYVFRQNGDLLFSFAREPGGHFKGQNIDLNLSPVGGRSGEAPRSDSVAATLDALNGKPPPRDEQRAALTGAYIVARERNGEGCAIELKQFPGPRPKKGGAIWSAALADSCDDEGLRVFDPVGWQYDDGRIFLVAKKGHTIGFTSDGPAGWKKDPAAGKPLWLRRK